MRELQDLEKRDNIQSLFSVNGIPSDNQIRNITDEIEPSELSPVFNDALKVSQQSGVVRQPVNAGLIHTAKSMTG